MTGLLRATLLGITRSSSPREQQPRLRETARQAEELMNAETNPHHEQPRWLLTLSLGVVNPKVYRVVHPANATARTVVRV